MYQTKINLFVSLFLQKNRCPVLVSYKLELGICLIVSDVSLQFSPTLQNIEVAFERCSTRVVVQQDDEMKCSSSAPVIKSKKVLHSSLLKTALHQMYSSKNLEQIQNSNIESWWLFLRTIIFWEHSWMAASRRQLQRYIHFKSSSHLWFNGHAYFMFLTVSPC